MSKLIGIIGGGASGLVAAINIKRNSENEVIILEKNDRIGRKILATGNGKCNLSNSNMSDSYYNNTRFVRNIYKQVKQSDVIEFFESLGLMTYEDEEGRIYPLSNSASAVLDVLRFECERLGVVIKTEFDVNEIVNNKGQFVVKSKDNRREYFDEVVVCAGGSSSPNLGTNGEIYHVLKRAGIKVTPVLPSLGPLKVLDQNIKSLNGIRLKCLVKLIIENDEVYQETGEVLFKENALSGIVIFQMAHKLCNDIRLFGKNKAYISLDLFEDMEVSELENLIAKRVEENGWKTLEQLFIGMLNKFIAIKVMKDVGIESFGELASSLKTKDIKRIAKVLKDMMFEVDLTNFASSQVTSGGVDVKEVDNQTLMSTKVDGMYFAGEVLDIDGVCGGYNLNFAFASAMVVAKNMK